MKRIVIALAICAAALPAIAEMETFNVDPRHTFPYYEVGHNGYALQRGRFNKTSGKILLDREAKKGSAEITVDATSVSTGIEKLDEHVKSDDFLKTGANPNITFKSTQFEFEGESLKRIVGELTIAGVTRPATLEVQAYRCGMHPLGKRSMCGADLVAKIRRSEFGVKYGLPNLADDMTLRITVEAIKDS